MSKPENKSILLDKTEFLKELTRMDKNQISKLIKEKGKQPKLICPIIVT